MNDLRVALDSRGDRRRHAAAAQIGEGRLGREVVHGGVAAHREDLREARRGQEEQGEASLGGSWDEGTINTFLCE